MRAAWIVGNAASGSTDDAGLQAVERALAAGGVTVAGRTAFPDAPLPTPAMLAGVDTVIAHAGDGTINAVACALEGWRGALLILPGGTMNLLARTLHGDRGPLAIVEAALRGPPAIALPTVQAGGHTAFVGLILGPAASWTRVREGVRRGRWRGLVRAVRHAWRCTFGDGIRVPEIDLHAQAVFVAPREASLSVAAVEARDWRSLADLGWNWLTGEWIAAGAVAHRAVPRLTLAGRRPVAALFDGELMRLPPGTSIAPGRSRPMFLATREMP